MIVSADDKKTQKTHKFQAPYIIGCDGANSITRSSMLVNFTPLATKRRVLNLLFEAPDLKDKIVVENGFLYYLLDSELPAVAGPIDLKHGIWYAQIFYEKMDRVEDIDLTDLLRNITGLTFETKILDAHFWDMQIQIAEHFAVDNRVFLVGDSAHAFAPTGGFGLNTGFGDVVNIGWKLAAVLRYNVSPALLETYEQERRPICIRNIEATEKNADAMANVRKRFPVEKSVSVFAHECANLANQHSLSAGLMMGYAYFNSPLTILQQNQLTEPMPQSIYSPIAKPGYVLPYKVLENESIYHKLSVTGYTLLISEIVSILPNLESVNILRVPHQVYSYNYILLRPDWHIVYAGDDITSISLKKLLGNK